MKPPNPFAFPQPLVRNANGEIIPACDQHPDYGGMELRDYFAAAALPAVITAYMQSNGFVIGTDHILRNSSVIAFKFADALLVERAKKPESTS